MRPLLPATLLAALALCACDNPKPRPAPSPDGNPPAAPKAEPAPAAAPAAGAPTPGLSAGLSKRPEFPGVYLDHIGAALDPVNRKPVVTPASAPLLLDGFGFDPVAKVPAKGVDVVVDGKIYGTTYGSPRQDVARYFKTPGLVPVGFKTTLPVGTVAAGPHTVVVRVISADGKGYFESPVFGFQMQ